MGKEILGESHPPAGSYLREGLGVLPDYEAILSTGAIAVLHRSSASEEHWTTNSSKRREKHEAVSPLSRSFVAFAVQIFLVFGARIVMDH